MKLHVARTLVGMLFVVLFTLTGPAQGQSLANLEKNPFDAVAWRSFLDSGFPEESDFRVVLDALYESHVDEIGSASAQYERSLQDVEARRLAFISEDPAAGDPFWDLGEDFGAIDVHMTWRGTRRRLLQEFETTIANVLDEEHLPAWRRTAREVWRARLLWELNPGSHESLLIDLAAFTRSLPLSGEEADRLADILVDYERSFDNLLIEYEEGSDAQLLAYFRLFLEGNAGKGGSRRRAVEIARDLRQVEAEILKVNRQFSPGIAATLEPQNRETFEKRRSVPLAPRLFQPSPVDEAVSLLLEESRELEQNLRAKINTVYDEYLLTHELTRGQFIRRLRQWLEPARLEKRRKERSALLQAARRGESVDHDEPLRNFKGMAHLARLYRLERDTLIQLGRLVPASMIKDDVGLRFLLNWGGE